MGKKRDYGGSEDSPDTCFGAPGSDADEPHSLPVLYGGTGRHGDWPWSNTHVVPAATNPSSTNPWISKYMDDIWAWSAPVSRSKLAVLG